MFFLFNFVKSNMLVNNQKSLKESKRGFGPYPEKSWSNNQTVWTVYASKQLICFTGRLHEIIISVPFYGD